MQILTAVIGFALVVGTFGQFQEWSPDNDADSDMTAFDGENFGDFVEDDDMDSFVKDMQTELKEDNAVQPLGDVSDVTEALDAVESDLGVGVCACKGHACSCCYQRRYRVLWKKYIINVCSGVAWAKNKFYFRMTFNKALVYHTYVTRDIGVCKRFPRTLTAKACTKLFRVNVGRRSFCINMYDRSWRRHVTHVNRCFRFVGDNGVADQANQLD